MADGDEVYTPVEALWLIVLLCMIGVGCEILNTVPLLGVATPAVLLVGAIAAGAIFVRMWMIFGRVKQAVRWEEIGHCPSCGYDLRATTEQCPECGSEVGRSKPSKFEDRG